MPYGLALHCWLFAPNSVTRKRADAIRLTTQAYDSHGLGFDEYGFDEYVKGVKSDCIVAQAIKIINCSDDLEDVRFAALQFAVSVLQKYPATLPPRCAVGLLDIMWRTLRARSEDIMYMCEVGNTFL